MQWIMEFFFIFIIIHCPVSQLPGDYISTVDYRLLLLLLYFQLFLLLSKLDIVKIPFPSGNTVSSWVSSMLLWKHLAAANHKGVVGLKNHLVSA